MTSMRRERGWIPPCDFRGDERLGCTFLAVDMSWPPFRDPPIQAISVTSRVEGQPTIMVKVQGRGAGRLI
jgi:hypothetical protein